jgi:hypothetical protein
MPGDRVVGVTPTNRSSVDRANSARPLNSTVQCPVSLDFHVSECRVLAESVSTYCWA